MEHSHPTLPAVLARRLLLLFGLLALLLAAPAKAAGATGTTGANAAVAVDDAPSFQIERITVAGNRRPAAARIVVSESLLKEGRTYSENELRTAIHRIKRLPFIIEADFALQKGSERGRYELIITIEETRPIFADLEIQGDLAERPIFENIPRTGNRFDFSDNSALGAREFLGSEGLVFASVGSAHGLTQVGYTRYDLFGPGSFASFALAYDPKNRIFTPALSAGVPLTVNQSLRATVSWVNAATRENGIEDQFNGRSGQLDWLYNTTDDPLFPTRGNEVEASLAYQTSHSVTRFGDPPFRLDDRTWSFGLTGLHNQPLTARQSLTFVLSAAAFRFQESTTTPDLGLFVPSHGYQASVSVAHAFDLWQGDRAHHGGDLRLETSAAYAATYAHYGQSSELFGPNPAYQLTLGETLVFRNPWAIVRLGLSYHGQVMR